MSLTLRTKIPSNPKLTAWETFKRNIYVKLSLVSGLTTHLFPPVLVLMKDTVNYISSIYIYWHFSQIIHLLFFHTLWAKRWLYYPGSLVNTNCQGFDSEGLVTPTNGEGVQSTHWAPVLYKGPQWETWGIGENTRHAFLLLSLKWKWEINVKIPCGIWELPKQK